VSNDPCLMLRQSVQDCLYMAAPSWKLSSGVLHPILELLLSAPRRHKPCAIDSDNVCFRFLSSSTGQDKTHTRPSPCRCLCYTFYIFIGYVPPRHHPFPLRPRGHLRASLHHQRRAPDLSMAAGDLQNEPGLRRLPCPFLAFPLAAIFAPTQFSWLTLTPKAHRTH
jgi:hypothetical protein